MNQYKPSFFLASTVYVGTLLAAGVTGRGVLGRGLAARRGWSFCLPMAFPCAQPLPSMSRGPRLGVLTCCCHNAASTPIRSIIIILPLFGVMFPSFLCARSQLVSAGLGKIRDYATGDISVAKKGSQIIVNKFCIVLPNKSFADLSLLSTRSVSSQVG